jgi:hypothetical protein
MSFKKFYQFLIEGKKPKKHEIKEVEAPKPKIDPNSALKCPKCGSSAFPCDCFIDDYYNSKLTQQTPKPNTTIKPNEKS